MEEERRPGGSMILKSKLEQLGREPGCNLADADSAEYLARRMDSADGEVDRMEHGGEVWDEVSNQQLQKAEAFGTRLEEIIQLHSHDVYENA